MKDLLFSSVFFGVFISLLGYEIGVLLKKKFKLAVLNPLLIAIIFVIAALRLLKIDYQTYYDGAQYLSYLLTPATVCLAVPLYEQLTALKHRNKARCAGSNVGAGFAVQLRNNSFPRNLCAASSTGHLIGGDHGLNCTLVVRAGFLFRVVGNCAVNRNRNRNKDTHDDNNDHQFNEGKALFVLKHLSH